MIRLMTSLRERFGIVDITIALVASILAVAYMAIQVPDDEIKASVWAVPVFVLVTLPLLWRRAAPLAALLLMLGGLLVHVAIFTDTVVRCGIILPVMLLLVYSAGARLDWIRSLAGFAAAMLIGTIVCFTDQETGADPGAISFVAILVVVVWGIGVLVHSRGRMVGELEARTKELRRTRDERARLEVASDRARLSAELDELLQRRLGDLASLADAGADPADPATTSETLVRIENDSRRTLEEMRAVVGVLRDDEAGASTTPAPTLTQLDALLVRAKGARARLTVEGRARALPPGVELSAYRVVEHLLDALEDSPDVEVVVRFADDALELRVSGDLRRRSGAAIERARERARLHHGEVATTTDGGRTEALVSLPIFATV
jgi:hypothetical protein